MRKLKNSGLYNDCFYSPLSFTEITRILQKFQVETKPLEDQLFRHTNCCFFRWKKEIKKRITMGKLCVMVNKIYLSTVWIIYVNCLCTMPYFVWNNWEEYVNFKNYVSKQSNNFVTKSELYNFILCD